MLRTCIALVAGLLVCSQTLFASLDANKENKDLPKQLEGRVKKTDQEGAKASLVITVKEKQPTDNEDMFREVEKDYQFQIGSRTKFIGLDSKPEKKGLKGLQAGDWVRVEYKSD